MAPKWVKTCRTWPASKCPRMAIRIGDSAESSGEFLPGDEISTRSMSFRRSSPGMVAHRRLL